MRNGLLFVGLWDDGVEIWDIGGCGAGASPESAATLGGREDSRRRGAQHLVVPRRQRLETLSRSSARKARAAIGSSSRGDIHVIDISDPTAPKEVAFYRVDGRRHPQLLGRRDQRRSLRGVLQRRRAGDRRPRATSGRARQTSRNSTPRRDSSGATCVSWGASYPSDDRA